MKFCRKAQNTKYCNDSTELSSAKKGEKRTKSGRQRERREKKRLSFKITEKANTSTFLPSSDKSVATAEIRKLVNAFGNCRV